MVELMNKSFTFEGINSEELRKFSCWGSVEVKDRHGEIIPAEEVYKVMDIWMDRGAPIQFNHTNRGVGKGLNWQPLEKNGKPGVLITAKIYRHYAEDDQVWEDLKKGKFEGLSIGGKSFSREESEEGTILRNLIGYEFSLAEKCGNQEATMVDHNVMAKSDNQEKMVEEVKKEEQTVTEEQAEVSLSDVMEAIAKLNERLEAVESQNSGKPAEEEEAEKAEESEAEEAEEDEEMQKTEEEPVKEEAVEEESEVVKALADVKAELAELKKSQVKEVIKTEVPEEEDAEEVAKSESFEAKLEAKVEEMKKSGNIDYSSVARMIEAEKSAELERKFK